MSTEKINYQRKHILEVDAIADAKKQSIDNPDIIFNVISAEGIYYVESGSSFIRNGEKLLAEYLLGMKLK